MLAALRSAGACFRSELASAAGRLDAEVDEGLWDLVARGIVTADAFSAVRSLLSARRRRPTGAARDRPPRGARSPAGRGRHRGRRGPLVAAARARRRPAPGPHGGPASEELAEAVAWQLLARWGVVAWELWARESYRIPWRDVVRALRRLEARARSLGGRFVAGISGEQYASPEAASLLADVRRDPGRGAEVEVAGADPLNLTGDHAGRGPGPLAPGPDRPLPRRGPRRVRVAVPTG